MGFLRYYGENNWEKKKAVRIDFVNLEEFLDESRSYPIGILSISASLKMNGFHNVGMVDHVCTLRKEAENSATPMKKSASPLSAVEAWKPCSLILRKEDLILF
jgi:hypothetical protein